MAINFKALFSPSKCQLQIFLEFGTCVNKMSSNDKLVMVFWVLYHMLDYQL